MGVFVVGALGLGELVLGALVGLVVLVGLGVFVGLGVAVGLGVFVGGTGR
ncbi:hypothetical protein FB565_006433 [Actinoplanes lutulentus]|nr:hypothetical protein [Actinoplanes lutulentus]MBB2946665.1 hypothetical protein [Actinoplanes lutulentus]